MLVHFIATFRFWTQTIFMPRSKRNICNRYQLKTIKEHFLQKVYSFNSYHELKLKCANSIDLQGVRED